MNARFRLPTAASVVSVALAAASLAWAGPALACGGAFGPGTVIAPSQTLVVAHKQGVETYVFQPHFCGTSTQFGLILPVPTTLSKNPALADPRLYEELDRVTAPEIVTQQVCEGDRDGGASAGGSDRGQGNGVDVVDRGQVGIFDWALVKADTKAAFTEWLDTNGFPHAPAADEVFAHYVAGGFSFVAFKVTAGPDAPPAGKKLCGDFGPIALAFPAAEAIVPARMAAVSAESGRAAWRIFALSGSATQLAASPTDPATAGWYASLSWANALSAADLQAAPALAQLAAPGDRLTRWEASLSFAGKSEDIRLTAAAPSSFRATVARTERVKCPGGAPGTGPGGADGASAGDGASGADVGGGAGCSTHGRSAPWTSWAAGLLGVSTVTAALRRRRRR